MRTVRDLMHTDLRTISSTESMLDAARAFAGEVLGLLIVVDKGALVGVLSERDVVRSLGDGDEPADTHVFDVMTEDVVTVTHDASVDEALKAMLASEIRHLVITEHGSPVAVLSARDLLRAQVSDA